MSSASKVGEIFTAAGIAFSKLGELTMQLHPAAEPAPAGGGKWTEQEINLLHTAVKQFGEDLNQISDIIKNRTVSQIRGQLKRKAFDEAGVSPQSDDKSKKSPAAATATSIVAAAKIETVPTVSEGEPSPKKAKPAEVTLSALNAPDVDVDVEGLGDQSSGRKLDFDSDVDSSIL